MGLDATDPCDRRPYSTNIALAFILVGLFAVFTAVTLYAIARLIQKTTK